MQQIQYVCVKCGCRSYDSDQFQATGGDFAKLFNVQNKKSVTISCRQCENAPCARICPTGALQQDDGIVTMNAQICSGCQLCIMACPYGAISYVDKEFRMPNRTTAIRRVAQVNSALCQGCGACTVACPSGAMDLQGFSNRQIIAEVDAICR